MADLTAILLRRYNRIMRRTLAGVVLVACVLVYVEVQQTTEAEKHLLTQRMEEHAVALDAILKNSSDAIKALQRVAHLRYRTLPEEEGPSPLLRALLASAVEGIANLDRPPPPWTHADVGNLTGPIGTPDASLRRELEVALALNSTFMATKANNPSAVALYYTSARDFINIFPWIPSGRFTFSPALQRRGFFAGGRPDADPGRAAFWTEAYLDDAGNGMMVTAAAPVYEGDTFRGTVALDVTLGELDRFVQGWRSAFGTLLVVNASGQVLAYSGTASASDTQPVPNLRSVLPDALRGDPEAALATAAAAGRGELPLVDGHYVGVRALENAPFRLVLVVPRAEMVAAALRGGLVGVVVLVAGLALMLLVATRLVRREFVAPAQQLVRFIEEESHGPVVAMPSVHTAWRPWFETIRLVFNAHSQLVSIQQELDVARRMQRSILPVRFPHRPDLQVFACMMPAKEVGGDFYDYFWLDDYRIGLVIADVSGKGVPAALFMAVARTLLRATAPVAATAARCLEVANDLLSQDNDAMMFVTVFYAILDTRTGGMTYANGGHNLPCVVAPDGAVSELPQTDGIALGAMEGVPFEQGATTLAPGSTLLLYTDGVTEAFDRDGRPFTEARLAAVLAGRQHAAAEALIGSVVDAVGLFAEGVPQADDITCLAVRFHAPVAARDGGTGAAVADAVA